MHIHKCFERKFIFRLKNARVVPLHTQVNTYKTCIFQKHTLLLSSQNADRICSREDILNGVWGQQFHYDTGTIDVHLHSLRH